MARQIYTDSEWTFELLERATDAIEQIAIEELELDYYPYRLEIISSEQMLDAYTSAGMPINYHHWSFGKHFLSLEDEYKRGRMGLAYEIVINSSPCIAYLMEENTMTMQTLVIAHAAFGHNAFMKNNYLFKQWTHADAIIDYLAFARKYVSDCEERYGPDEVEDVLDACHALAPWQGIDRVPRAHERSLAKEEQRLRERAKQREHELDVLLPEFGAPDDADLSERPLPAHPEENILYFIEKHAPELEDWKREIIRIVRKIAQYFYPQYLTKVLNEGFATFTHYYIMNRLAEKGLLASGAMQEFLRSHTNVIAQPDFGEINPYALGFALFQDIRRICESPTDEDREWFPDIAGSPWLETVHDVACSFRDDSAILQFLSPRLIRHFRYFVLRDDSSEEDMEVTAIHDAAGYRDVRRALSGKFDPGVMHPNITVQSVDRLGDRTMTLHHDRVNNRPLDPRDAQQVLQYVERLWGFPIVMEK